MTINCGDIAPDFTLAADDGSSWCLSSAIRDLTLLVFYPGDDTPVCTAQLCDYRDGIEAFRDLGVDVIGISKNDSETHRKFKQKHALPFTLLSDPGLTVAQQYDCKGLLGMKRGVFLLDRQCRVRYRHVEALPLFRRKRDELVDIIREIKNEQ